MTSIDDALKQSLRVLACRNPYSKLSVSTICKHAHVSTSAFYSRFRNKDELLGALLYDDICAPVVDIRSAILTKKYRAQAARMMDLTQCDNILEHMDFYKKLVADSPNTFVDELTNGLIRVNGKVLKPYDIDDTEKEYMSFFFASSHAMLYRKWIEDGAAVDAACLCEWYFKWAVDGWQRISRAKGIVSDSDEIVML